MLQPENTLMMLVDVQGKLAGLMHDREVLFSNIERMIRAMQLLDVPILWIEQIPKKMGQTLPRLAALLDGLTPIPKSAFSGCGEPAVRAALDATARTNVLLTGIETHVCVYQTAVELLAADYHVEIVADAVSSRTRANKQVGLDRMTTAGALKTSTEMAILELTRSADHPRFREILRLIR